MKNVGFKSLTNRTVIRIKDNVAIPTNNSGVTSTFYKSPSIALIISKNNKPIQMVRYRRKRAFRRFIEPIRWSECSFKLIVNYGNGYSNQGEYQNKRDLIQAYEDFTENSLVEYARHK